MPQGCGTTREADHSSASHLSLCTRQFHYFPRFPLCRCRPDHRRSSNLFLRERFHWAALSDHRSGNSPKSSSSGFFEFYYSKIQLLQQFLPLLGDNDVYRPLLLVGGHLKMTAIVQLENKFLEKSRLPRVKLSGSF